MTAAPTFRIRLAEPADAAVLPAVERSAAEAFRPIPSLAWIADDDVLSEEVHLEYIAAGNSWVSIDETGRQAGFLSGEICGRDLHIWELAVRHDRQRSGHGSALIGAAIDRARKRRLTGITLTTFRGIPWNEPFYARLGFRTLHPDQLGDRLGRILRNEAERGLPADRRCAMRYDTP